MVDLLTARQDFSMNAKVVHVADQIERRALDILA
jgi:hypothetical protein